MPFEKEQKIAEEENFKHFDSNKDAVLDKEEIAAWAMPSHEEAAEEEAEHLIEVMAISVTFVEHKRNKNRLYYRTQL